MKTVRSRLAADLSQAMKEKNAVASQAIRSLLAGIDNAGAVQVEEPVTMPMAGGIAGATEGVGSTEAPRIELSDEDIKQIIQKEIDEMAEAAELIKGSARPEVEQLAEKINLLKKYL